MAPTILSRPSSPPNTITTRICMISDTHTSLPNPPHMTDNAYRSPLPKADVLLHAGDLTKVGYRVENEAMIAMLKDADAELKLVIAGNHDITLDEEYFASFGYNRHSRPEYLGDETILLSDDDIHQIRQPSAEQLRSYARSIKDLWTCQAARDAGIVYLEEGVHSFTLSTGATFTVYASPYQPEFYRWAFAYERDEDRYNSNGAANPIPDFPAVDILLTHGPPLGILDQVPPDLNVGCEHLLRAAGRARPRIHLFGHIHEGWGAQRGIWNGDGLKLEDVPTDIEDMLENRSAFYDVSEGAGRPLRFGDETLFVNASVNTVKYEARNAPWVVDLELSLAAQVGSEPGK